MTEEVAPPLDLAGEFTDLGAAEMVRPDFIIDDWICTGMVVVGGQAKSLKSTLAMCLTLLASGNKCRVIPPVKVHRHGRADIFSFEASAGELRYMVEHEMGLRIPADQSVLVCDDPWDFQIDDPEGIEKLLYWCNETKPLLVVLDPLRDFHSLDENDSGAIIKALRPLQRWAKENKSCVLIVHHAKKKDEGRYNSNDLRGTSALFGMVDGCLIVTREGETTLHVAATFKRGASWERTLELAAYANKGEVASEPLGEVDKMVLRLLRAGAPNVASIAKQLRCAKGMVVESCKRLQRNQLAMKKGKKWKAVKR